MTLHIFNPEHDIALAQNLSNFTAPHAARQLRHDLGFLPVLWADEGDRVVADNVEAARTACERLFKSSGVARPACMRHDGDVFMAWNRWLSTIQPGRVEPWGWDKALCAQLKRHGVSTSLWPDASRLEAVRDLSHRRLAAALLPALQMEGTVGQMQECHSAGEVEQLAQQYERLVLKAPWSSSGRGVRFLDPQRTPLALHAGWLKNLLQLQGSVMVEPLYNKVKDFGMEFACREGRVEYLGLSLFHTVNGAYAGNVLATEVAKREQMGRYLPTSLLDAVQTAICQQLSPRLCDRYEGPFGVDMMVVANPAGGFLLHPCVEINLRRTMGHVALAAERLWNTQGDDDVQHVMRIEFSEQRYRLKVQKL